MKNALIQLALFAASILVSDAQGPKKPPVLDIPRIDPRGYSGCPVCSRKDPVVEEGLSPRYSTRLPECDRVEVFLLADDFKPGTAADRFPIRPDHGTSGIIGRKDLIGDQASKLCALWRGLTFDVRIHVFSPPAFTHGLRFYQAGTLVFETSVSLTNHNFYYPRTAFPAQPGVYSWHGFRTYDEAGKALAAFLNATLPIQTEKPKE